MVRTLPSALAAANQKSCANRNLIGYLAHSLKKRLAPSRAVE
jgi:hypothetical protein